MLLSTILFHFIRQLKSIHCYSLLLSLYLPEVQTYVIVIYLKDESQTETDANSKS